MASSKSLFHRFFNVDVSAHGDISQTHLDKDVNLEVICLGLPRTGTTSLQAALTQLGYAPSHQGVDLFRNPTRNEAFIALFRDLNAGKCKAGDPALTARLRKLMQGYRSTTDNPIAYLGLETFAAYPDAKYILTTRPGGGEAWYKSLWAATGWYFRRDMWRTIFRASTYSVRFLRRTDDRVQLMHALFESKFGPLGPGTYDAHNKEIAELIPREQLLVYDVREGWEPLCEFLGKAVPEKGYPVLNDSEAMQKIFVGMMAYGAFVWAVYFGVVGGAAYVAWRPEVLGHAWRLLSTVALQAVNRLEWL